MGAVDCVLKPSGKPIGDLELIRDELYEKVKWAARSRSRVATLAGDASRTPVRDSRTSATTVPEPPAGEAASLEPRAARSLVVIASSTGGPRALQEFFRNLPSGLPSAFVVVQHISLGFTKALARRLDETTRLRAAEAEEGETLLEGRVYVAPAGKHLVVTGAPGVFKAAFKDDPPRLGVKPSGDLMMASAAKVAGKALIGVVLTGMGKDGTEGLKAVKKAGGRTFAQDEASCVVYGMPKSAMEAKTVDEQADPAGIAARVTLLVRGG
jgi:two-component system chemotaxis response regulator CheB